MHHKSEIGLTLCGFLEVGLTNKNRCVSGGMCLGLSTLFVCSMGSMKCEKARYWKIPVVSVKWLTDIILGDLSTLKLPISPCYTSVSGHESFDVDLSKVYHLLGTYAH